MLGQVGRLVASPRTLGVHVCVDMSLARTSFMRREQQRGESSGSEGPAQNEPTAVLGTLREGVEQLSEGIRKEAIKLELVGGHLITTFF